MKSTLMAGLAAFALLGSTPALADTMKAPPGLESRETLPHGLDKRSELPQGLQGRIDSDDAKTADEVQGSVTDQTAEVPNTGGVREGTDTDIEAEAKADGSIEADDDEAGGSLSGGAGGSIR